MKYNRIYCDAADESHFEDVSVKLAPVDFAPPAPPLNIADPIAAERMILCYIPRAWIGDWHPAPKSQFYFQLSGRLEITVSDGEVREFSAGSIILIDYTSGIGHVTKTIGDEAVHGVFVQLPEANGIAV